MSIVVDSNDFVFLWFFFSGVWNDDVVGGFFFGVYVVNDNVVV